MDFNFFSWQKTELVFVAAVAVAIFFVSAVQLRTGEMKTRDTQRKTDAGQLARVLREFRDDHKELPTASPDGKILSCGGQGSQACEWGDAEIRDSEGVSYMRNVPKDPLAHAGRTYIYEVLADRLNFRIYVALENSRDAGLRRNLTNKCGTNVQCNWYEGY